ncbi:MAG TPA: gamma-glutamyltransferase family protein [Alphaproteobacteria bacterium]|nr:gamma-glutamyltransferase family protein [Alphaproteobacteria bacterium]
MPMQPMVQGHRYMVSAGHYLATEAGAKMLEAGGNAVDAGVAAGIALGVVHSDQVQFSGVAPILIYLAERDQVVSIAGLGPWPAATRPEVFIHQHEGQIPLGLLRTVVPAAPDAWITALARYGTMSFAEVAAPAIRYAREGFAVHPVMAHFIGVYRDQYRMFPDNAAIWLRDGEPPKVGDLHVQADLARTIQFMADEETAARAKGGRAAGLEAARAAFYKGDIARSIVRFHEEHDGWLTAADMAAYQSPVEKPLRVDFQGQTVYSCGPWCQGPILLQMLRLLEGVDLKAMGHNSADYIHTLAEAMKLAFADRERYYGDPAHVDVPMDRLLASDYAAARRRLIDPQQAIPEMAPAGDIPGFGGVPFVPMPDPQPTALHPDTSYCCVVDGQGNVWSATPSDVSFESPVIPGLGIVPSARGAQSFAREGHASAPAPGKRPRLTPNPAMVVTPGKLAMPFGSPGGDTQPQGMLQVLLNHVIWGMDIQDAIEAPRAVTHAFPMTFEPHRYHPGRLSVEGRIEPKVRDDLAGRGHEIEVLDDIATGAAGVCAISANLETGLLSGGADPRRAARAMGF